MSNPMGISPMEYNVATLIMGSSYPMMYAEIGIMLPGLSPGTLGIPESVFRPRFLNMCQRGLICWKDPSQVWEHFKERRYILTPRGEALIRDWNIINGGDYSYNRYFDGSTESLDKVMPGKQKMVFDGASANPTKAQVWDPYNKSPEALHRME